MKIGNLTELYGKDPLTGNPLAGKSTQPNARSTTTPTTLDSGGSGANTTASISSLSSTLAALEPELRAPEFDEAKVESIKQAIRDGKFEVNANAVADKLISSVQELIGNKSKA